MVILYVTKYNLNVSYESKMLRCVVTKTLQTLFVFDTALQIFIL
jgi:hypothetical protein